MFKVSLNIITAFIVDFYQFFYSFHLPLAMLMRSIGKASELTDSH